MADCRVEAKFAAKRPFGCQARECRAGVYGPRPLWCGMAAILAIADSRASTFRQSSHQFHNLNTKLIIVAGSGPKLPGTGPTYRRIRITKSWNSGLGAEPLAARSFNLTRSQRRRATVPAHPMGVPVISASSMVTHVTNPRASEAPVSRHSRAGGNPAFRR